jgi:hypothetical protein
MPVESTEKGFGVTLVVASQYSKTLIELPFIVVAEALISSAASSSG